MAKIVRLVTGAVAVATTAATAAPAALADPIVLEVLHAYGGHQRFHQPIAEAFMEQNPDIEIRFRAPARDYLDGHQAVLRQSLTGDMPDVFYTGYSFLGEIVGVLGERGQVADLTPLMAAEGEAWIHENYAPEVLSLGQVDGVQWSLPFNASTPIVYYNLDLVAQAGGDVDNLPSDWDGVIDLAARISALGDDVDGMSYWVAENSDWLWQALVFNYGGDIMDEAGIEVTFDSEPGFQSAELIRRFATDAAMPSLTEEQSIQQFAAGRIGIFFGSTAEVRVMGDLVGDNFTWRTARYPVADDENGRLPVGGNTALILADDPERQAAAWEFVKFVTGPEGQMIAILGSGYMPTNLRTTAPEYLGNFYDENPDWTTSLSQWPVARAWFGYPGTNGLRIWRTQQEFLGGILRGDIEPRDGITRMAAATEDLLQE